MTPTMQNVLTVTDADKAAYAERGYWISPKLFDDDEIATLRDEIVRVMNGQRDSVNFGWQGPRPNDVNGKGVCQFTNAWWINKAIRRAVTKPAIGYIGAQLMDSPEARIWPAEA